jgi:hypothetical protein
MDKHDRVVTVQVLSEGAAQTGALREQLAEASSAREVLAFALAHLLHTHQVPQGSLHPVSPILPGPETEALRQRIRYVAESEGCLDPDVRAAFVRESVAIANTILRQAPSRQSEGTGAVTPGVDPDTTATPDSARLDSAMLCFVQPHKSVPSSGALPAASAVGDRDPAVSAFAKSAVQPLHNRDDSARSPFSAAVSVAASATNPMVTPSFPEAASVVSLCGSVGPAAVEVVQARVQTQLAAVPRNVGPRRTLHDQLAAHFLELPDSGAPVHQASLKALGVDLETAMPRTSMPPLATPRLTPFSTLRPQDPCLSPPTPPAAAAAEPFSEFLQPMVVAGEHTHPGQADSVNPLFIASPRPLSHNAATNPVYVVSPIHHHAPSAHNPGLIASPPVTKGFPNSYRSLHQHQVQMQQQHRVRQDRLHPPMPHGPGRDVVSTYRSLQRKRIQDIARNVRMAADKGSAPASDV